MTIRNILTAAALLVSGQAVAQNIEIVDVKLMGRNTTISPVVVDSVLYFSSDAKNDVGVNYYDQNGDRLFQLYSVKLKNKKPHGRIRSVMAQSNCPYNRTAIAFDSGKGIHITQNTQVESTINGAPLAIFDYNSVNDKYGKQNQIKQNYANVAYPTYSPDGKLMIYVSDQPGGEGQSDLYYCEYRNGRWSEPRNMGAVINTRGTETAPYIHSSGKIFFASNGRRDSKKLDIYYTYRINGGFAEPVRFDTKINSMGDDFGIYISENEDWGYFTSNRHGIDKIYLFMQKFPSFKDAKEMEEENFCYTFFEESAENYDPDQFGFKWAISDGKSYNGLEIDHCFTAPGVYTISLSVLDKTTNEELFTIAEYEMEIVRPEQVNIHVPESIKVGQEVTFTADTKNISTLKPTTFYWDFGNGLRVKGEKGIVTFHKKGKYKVKCGTIDAEDPSVTICTWVTVFVE